jgi:glycosyltransferase involved in cell wall biosynthesis
VRLLLVVQRYGEEIAGGSEAAARQFAERLVTRRHQVEVVTSCALHYTDWADHFPPGTTTLNGVRVHRLHVAHGRATAAFGALQRVIHGGPAIHPLALQESWLRAQGPVLDGLERWLIERATRFDAVLVFTYLYPPAVAALAALAGRVPVVFLPTAHRELYLDLPMFDSCFALADGFAFLTPEEEQLVDARFGIGQRPSSVVGIGIDLPGDVSPKPFRRTHALDDDPYLLCLGRVDEGKGAVLLHDYFRAYKERHGGTLRLVYVGERIAPIPESPDVVLTGFVDEADKQRALAGALALAQPSFFESFSMVLCEAWAHGRPVLVNSACRVLANQTARARAGLPFDRYASFEAALDELVDTPGLADTLGAAGRRFIEQEYEWPVVLARLEALIEATMRHAARRWPTPAAAR